MSVNEKEVEIKSNNSASSKDDKIFVKSIYKILSVTTFLLIINIIIFIAQIIAYYAYYKLKDKSWDCLLMSFGAFQGGKIRNHYHYHRFFTSMFLHNSTLHLVSNCISLFFLGYHVENEINNKLKYILLYLISGLSGNFLSLLFDQKNISVGASGAIIGLCGYFVIYFILNYKNMSKAKKISYAIIFIFLFINLFSGFFEVGINMACHFGGLLGGFAFSSILIYGKYKKLNIKLAKTLLAISILFLIILPIITIAVIYTKNISNTADYIFKS
jgi:rhomboid protease GluP